MPNRDRVFDPYHLDRPFVDVGSETYEADPADDAILQLGRLAATRVNEESMHGFRQQLLRRRTLYPPSSIFIEEWLRIVDDGTEAVSRALRDETERGRALRTVAPLRAFISDVERQRLVRWLLRNSDDASASQ